MTADRPADVVTMLWGNDDGTVVVEITDFRFSPPQRERRIFCDIAEMDNVAATVARASVEIPQEAPLA